MKRYQDFAEWRSSVYNYWKRVYENLTVMYLLATTVDSDSDSD